MHSLYELCVILIHCRRSLFLDLISFSLLFYSLVLDASRHIVLSVVTRPRAGRPSCFVSIPGSTTILFSFPNRPDRLWLSPILCKIDSGVLYPAVKRWGVKVTTYLFNIRLRMSEVISLRLHKPSWRARRQLS